MHPIDQAILDGTLTSAMLAEHAAKPLPEPFTSYWGDARRDDGVRGRPVQGRAHRGEADGCGSRFHRGGVVMKIPRTDATRRDQTEPDPNKFYEWIAKIRVNATWVADGFDLTAERAHRMVSHDLSYAHSFEIETEILSAPDADAVAREQGYAGAKERHTKNGPDEPMNVGDAAKVSAALTLLREARNLLAQAGCPKVINRVRLAITSCKGAVENARHRPLRVADGRVKRIKRVPKVKITNVK